MILRRFRFTVFIVYCIFMTSCATTEYVHFTEISEQAEIEIEDGQIFSEGHANGTQDHLSISF